MTCTQTKLTASFLQSVHTVSTRRWLSGIRGSHGRMGIFNRAVDSIASKMAFFVSPCRTLALPRFLWNTTEHRRRLLDATAAWQLRISANGSRSFIARIGYQRTSDGGAQACQMVSQIVPVNVQPPQPPSYEVLEHNDGSEELYISPLSG